MNFITTTLPYANSIPHVGHALEFVQGDFWKRVLPNSYLNVGLDEHGKKIYQSALKDNKDPQEFVDDLHNKWVDFCKLFNIDYDNFYRTSSDKHITNVKFIWNIIKSSGDIYLKDYEGKYCTGCEEFKKDNQIENNHCIDHPTIDLEAVKEENFFFKLSNYKYNIDYDIVFPVNKRNELKNVIENGVDVSVSRKGITWGIPVPDSDQTIYVWFEALLNYVLSNKNWNNSSVIQICGPDNLRFQGHFFQGILKSLKLNQTNKLLVHGTILDKNGVKMSKSLGNTIDPVEQVNKYGIHAVRYYLLSGISTFGNSNWDEERLIDIYNSDICDNFGNLVSRVIHLHKIKNIKDSPDPNFVSDIVIDIQNLKNDLGISWDIQNYLQGISSINKRLNKYINDEEPWKNDNPIVLSNLYYAVREITELYRPVFGDEKINNILESIDKKEKQVFFPKI